jgi:hypothetical protein
MDLSAMFSRNVVGTFQGEPQVPRAADVTVLVQLHGIRDRGGLIGLFGGPATLTDARLRTFGDAKCPAPRL